MRTEVEKIFAYFFIISSAVDSNRDHRMSSVSSVSGGSSSNHKKLIRKYSDMKSSSPLRKESLDSYHSLHSQEREDNRKGYVTQIVRFYGPILSITVIVLTCIWIGKEVQFYVGTIQERLVNKLGSSISTVDGHCVKDIHVEKQPVVFPDNMTVPWDPCSIAQIRDSCCEGFVCDSSAFYACHCHTNIKNECNPQCGYDSFACYNPLEYNKMHTYDIYNYSFMITGVAMSLYLLYFLLYVKGGNAEILENASDDGSEGGRSGDDEDGNASESSSLLGGGGSRDDSRDIETENQ